MGASPRPAADTAARSLAHWSEASRAEMEAFYVLAHLDYRLLAQAVDWRALLGGPVGRLVAGRPLTLLDVACGSGKFPTALDQHADLGVLDGRTVDYALLDPSTFSLTEAAAALVPPFVAGARYETTLEDLDPTVGPWDVVWATHALYALEPARVEAAVARFAAAIAPGGVGLLAQGARDGHYLHVYDAFLEGARGGSGTSYVSSDDLLAALRAQGHRPLVRRLHYDHVVAEAERATVEGFLQRCLFDDTLSLDAMLDAPVLGPYLDACQDRDAEVWRFHHEVDVVVLGHPEGHETPWTAGS